MSGRSPIDLRVSGGWMPAGVIGVATAGLWYLSFDRFNNDHFLHLARAQQILLGALPVRDFVESGLPLMALASAAAQASLGPSLHAEVLFIAAMYGAAAGLLSLFARWTSGWTMSLVSPALLVFAAPISYSYPKVLPHALVFVCAAAFLALPGLRRLTMLAAAVVLAFLFRHDHGMTLGVGAAAMVLTQAADIRSGARRVTQFVGIGLLIVLPYLLWVQAYEGVAAYVADAMSFSNREMSKATWALPRFVIESERSLVSRTTERRRPIVNVQWRPGLPEAAIAAAERRHRLVRRDSVDRMSWQYELDDWSEPALRRLIGDPDVHDTHGIDRQRFTLSQPPPEPARERLSMYPAAVFSRANGVAASYYLAWLLPVAGLCVLLVSWSRLPPPLRALIVMGVVVQLLMNRVMLRDPLETRVRDVIAPMAALLPLIVAAAALATRVSARRVGQGIAIVLVCGTMVATALAGAFTERLQDAGLTTGVRGVGNRLAELRAEFAPPNQRTGSVSGPLRDLIDYLRVCTPPDGRFLNLAFVPQLMYFTGRGFAGGQESLVPGFYNAPHQVARLLDRVSREDVPFVFMDSETMLEIRGGYPRIVAHVDRQYRELTRVGPDEKAIVVFVRRAGWSYEAPNGYPCFVPVRGEVRS